MFIAITRQVSPAIIHCELTHLQRQPIDLQTARSQHAAYESTLASLGVQVHSLPADPNLPDSVFVEDAALVLDELAVITRPGAESRRNEVDAIAGALHYWRGLEWIQPPGTLDGGDILQVGKQVFVGLSSRSNREAIRQLQKMLKRFGYKVKGVPVTGCLHLKSAVTCVAPESLLINPAWVDADEFAGYHLIEVDPGEPYAANALPVGEVLLYQPSFPHTGERLQTAGLTLRMVDTAELGKAEGALTCCSLLFSTG